MSIVLSPDLEDRISVKVKSGRYRSAAEVIQASLDLLEAKEAAVEKTSGEELSPIWETVAQIGREVSQDQWSQVPSDLARDLDRYLHGSPKEL